jgi:hypothetical protein
MGEPVSFDEPVPFDEAATLLQAVRAGLTGDDPVPDPPLVVVALDASARAGSDSRAPLRPPVQWPCIVVAVNMSAGSLPAEPPAGADLYLTDAVDPPRPWVGSTDPTSLAKVVRERPQASTTLIQVLRAHRGEVEPDLLTESLAYASLQSGGEHRSWLDANRGRHHPDDDRSPAVRVTRSAGTLDVVLDRPGRRNAYSARMRDELVDALQLACCDPTITQVHLRGTGRTFCSGGDLAEFGSVENTATAHQIRMTRSAGHAAHLVATKLAAHVHGACVGAGVELPAFAGLVTAARGTTFRLPEVGMGLIPGAGGTASIPRRIGRERTAWLALAGEELDVETALRWGLVDSITPD